MNRSENMAQEKFLITQAGLDELKKEQDELIHDVRKEVIRELQEARAQGDLSENADYDAARDHQARVEARIRDLEAMIANAEIIEEDKNASSSKTVTLGSTVTIIDLSTNEEETYTIVGSIEADPLNGKLSNITPLAIALMDNKAGDVITVQGAEIPYDVKIKSLK